METVYKMGKFNSTSSILVNSAGMEKKRRNSAPDKMETAYTMDKLTSMSSNLVNSAAIEKKRRKSAPGTALEKKFERNRYCQKVNKTDQSSQPDFEIAWGSIFINFFLGIFLPTLDVVTDMVFLIGKLEALYWQPDQIFLSEDEACK